MSGHYFAITANGKTRMMLGCFTDDSFDGAPCQPPNGFGPFESIGIADVVVAREAICKLPGGVQVVADVPAMVRRAVYYTLDAQVRTGTADGEPLAAFVARGIAGITQRKASALVRDWQIRNLLKRNTP